MSSRNPHTSTPGCHQTDNNDNDNNNDNNREGADSATDSLRCQRGGAKARRAPWCLALEYYWRQAFRFPSVISSWEHGDQIGGAPTIHHHAAPPNSIKHHPTPSSTTQHHPAPSKPSSMINTIHQHHPPSSTPSSSTQHNTIHHQQR